MLAGMTRFLFASMAAHGHVGPLLPVAGELLFRGHEVVWYTGVKVRSKVEATGARYLPHVQARDVDAFDVEFPERVSKKGLARFRYDVREISLRRFRGRSPICSPTSTITVPMSSSPSRRWPRPRRCSTSGVFDAAASPYLFVQPPATESSPSLAAVAR